MANSQKQSVVLLGCGLLVIIEAGVWVVCGRITQIYEKTEEIFVHIICERTDDGVCILREIGKFSDSGHRK